MPLSLREEAERRAEAAAMSEFFDGDVFNGPPHESPNVTSAKRTATAATVPSSESMAAVSSSITTNPSAASPVQTNNNSTMPATVRSNHQPNLASAARKEWRQFGGAQTQALEDLRNSSPLVLRVGPGESRRDVGGSSYTAYPVDVMQRQQGNSNAPQSWRVEHRYSDFEKLHRLCTENGVILDKAAAFPPKHWAGRMGRWTPSTAWAPERHDALIHARSIQLDVWLVNLGHERFLRQANGLPPAVEKEFIAFLGHSSQHRRPCERENAVDSHSRWNWHNPVSFTLGSAIRQATQTVRAMCFQKSVHEADKSIPLDLLQQAKGLVFMTVIKGGLVVSGRIGTGLVIARNNSNQGWSAPVAVGTLGVGWGALIGGDVTHYLIVLTTDQAVRDFATASSVQLGAELGVAVGPLGRGANSHVRSGDWTVHPAYAYAHSHGLFVGMSLEGSVCRVRHDVNAQFYGRRDIPPAELIATQGPKAAEPLYVALQEALSVEIRDGAFRPSQLFASQCAANQFHNDNGNIGNNQYPQQQQPPQYPPPHSSPVVFQPNLMQSTYTVQSPPPSNSGGPETTTASLGGS